MILAKTASGPGTRTCWAKFPAPPASVTRGSLMFPDADQVRRLLALAAIYDGGSRTEAAAIGGVTLQVVRDWCFGSMRAARTAAAAGC